MNSKHINFSCAFKWEIKIQVCLGNSYKNVLVKNKLFLGLNILVEKKICLRQMTNMEIPWSFPKRGAINAVAAPKLLSFLNKSSCWNVIV